MKRIINFRACEGDPNKVKSNEILVVKNSRDDTVKSIQARDLNGNLIDIVSSTGEGDLTEYEGPLRSLQTPLEILPTPPYTGFSKVTIFPAIPYTDEFVSLTRIGESRKVTSYDFPNSCLKSVTAKVNIPVVENPYKIIDANGEYTYDPGEDENGNKKVFTGEFKCLVRVPQDKPIEDALHAAHLEYLNPILLSDISTTALILEKYSIYLQKGFVTITELKRAFSDNTLQIKKDRRKIIYLSDIQATGDSSLEAVISGFPQLIYIESITLNNITTTSLSSMFSGCSSLVNIFSNITIPATVTDLTSMFKGCSSLTRFPIEDTSNVTNMRGMIASCVNLESLILNMSSISIDDNAKINEYGGTFEILDSLSIEGTIHVNLLSGCFNNMPALSVESLMSIINALEDFSSGEVHSCVLSSANLSKLSQDQIQVATNKNWTLS